MPQLARPTPPLSVDSAPGRLVPRPRFRADIEGLRAVAVLLVVLYHAGVPGFGGGYVGVDVFFVLSGYLITWLLVHEAEETGTVDLVRFYARRARRLLPAIAVVLVATVAVGALVLAPFEQADLAKSAVATAVYLSNVFFARRATDYLGAAAEHDPLLHTWSLSVEEQFYLVWPVFVLFALGAFGWQRRAGRRPSRRRLVGWMGAVLLVSFGASVLLMSTHQPWSFFLSPLRAWEFAAGALGMLVGGGGAAGSRRLNPGRVGAVEQALGWAGLVAILAVGVAYGAGTLFPGWAALPPVLATVLVVRAGTSERRTALARTLGLRPLQEIGRLSYSWYLWHWPVLVYAEALGWAETLPARLALLGVSLALAEASYRLVENPVRYHPALAGRPRAGRSLALGAALTVLGVALGLGWLVAADGWAQTPRQVRFTAAADDDPVFDGDGCIAEYADVDLSDCAYGPADADSTVVLFGDSHAAHWYPAVRALAEDRGWRLVPLIKSACPPADVAFTYGDLGRPYTECGVWRETALDRIEALRPALVVAASSASYPVSEESGVTLDSWTAGTARTLGRLSESAARVVHVEDSPRPDFDVPACLAREAWRPWGSDAGCAFAPDGPARRSVFAGERQAARAFGNVDVVSLNDVICGGASCPATDGGHVIYRDSNHLTASYVAALAPTFVDRVGAPAAGGGVATR